jgi:hypothetical protein
MVGGAAVKSSDEDRAQLRSSLHLGRAPVRSLFLRAQSNNDVARSQAEALMFNRHYTVATIPAYRVMIKYGESDFDAITGESKRADSAALSHTVSFFLF